MINVQDGSKLRNETLGQLLTLKENQCEDNMPTGVLDFISCIRKAQTNMNFKSWRWKGNQDKIKKLRLQLLLLNFRFH
jgi:hypothetical protein